MGLPNPDPDLLAWAKKNPRAAARAALRARHARIAEARRDVNAFCEFVMRHDKTGEPLQQGAIHEEWHQTIDENDRVQIWGPLEHGKTIQLAVARPLFKLGTDPELRLVIVSNTARQAEKIAGPIRKYIEESSELHEVFPNLLPGESDTDKWTDSMMTVRRKTIAVDPSIQAIGVHGPVTGSRIDGLVLDDILDFENTRTQGQRDDVWDWLLRSVVGRLTPAGWAYSVSNAWHPKDAVHRLVGELGWKGVRTPAIVEAGPRRGLARWPEVWTPELLQKKRAALTPVEFERQFMCRAYAEGASRFDKAWIDKSFDLGKDRQFRSTLQPPAGVLVVIGVDLAVQPHSAADETVIFVIAVLPNETREVICIESGRWTGPVIIEKIYSAYSRFNAHKIVVESNGAQAFIQQFAADRFAMPVTPFTTTAQNKMHPEFGVESIAAEMANGKWIFPCAGGKPVEMQALEAEMTYYRPDDHTGDRLMAMFFAREGARGGVKQAETGRVDWGRR